MIIKNTDGLSGFTQGKEYTVVSKSGKEFYTVLNDLGQKVKVKQKRFS